MKYLLVILMFSSSIFLVNAPTALANTNNAELDRYQFSELETVDRIRHYTIKGWHYVDARSIIVDVSPGTSYLLILNREEHDFRFAEHVRFSSTNSDIYARFDTVTPVRRYGINIPVPIAKIYKLNGREDKKAVREQIRAS